jgi:hypothetical protein
VELEAAHPAELACEGDRLDGIADEDALEFRVVVFVRRDCMDGGFLDGSESYVVSKVTGRVSRR